jgi:hypothetical protein
MIAQTKLSKIKREIEEAAFNHLNAKTADDALSHFHKDIIAVSNDKLFTSYKELARDVREYYKILKRVNFSRWEDIQIQVIDQNTATFTAKFRYTFTTIENKRIDLKGIWTALYVRENSDWKIRLRHESFTNY